MELLCYLEWYWWTKNKLMPIDPQPHTVLCTRCAYCSLHDRLRNFQLFEGLKENVLFDGQKTLLTYFYFIFSSQKLFSTLFMGKNLNFSVLLVERLEFKAPFGEIVLWPCWLQLCRWPLVWHCRALWEIYANRRKGGGKQTEITFANLSLICRQELEKLC